MATALSDTNIVTIIIVNVNIPCLSCGCVILLSLVVVVFTDELRCTVVDVVNC